jgi:hypothetical protein
MLAQVPGRVLPFPEDEQDVITVDWLRAGVDDGRFPAPRDVSTAVGLGARLRLSILQSNDDVDLSCTPIREARELRLERGQVLLLGAGAQNGVRIQSRAPGSDATSGVTYDARIGRTLEVLDGPLDVRVVPKGQLRLCT